MRLLTDDAEVIHRERLKRRIRRLIFNNDGDDHFGDDPSPEALLARRTGPLAGTQADSVFYCTSRTFDMFTHPTRTGEVFDKPHTGPRGRNLIPEMLAAGHDPLQVTIDHCRSKDMEIFWSMRVNDVHDALPTETGTHPFFSRFKQKHPECLFGTPAQPPPCMAWSGVDFAQPLVREMFLAHIGDVVGRYDVDGIELDFMRSPVLLRDVAWGRAATDDQRQLITDLVHEVRRLCVRAGQQRGRPLLIAMRVPDSVAYARTLGLDWARWLEAGLLDLLILAGGIRLEPWRPNVALAHRHGVPIYPSLDESKVAQFDEHGERFSKARRWEKLRNSLISYRARAMNAWSAGADGIYLFNYFFPHSPAWRELGELETLRGQDKVYFASVRGCGKAAGLPWDAHQQLPTLNSERPIQLEPSEPVTLKCACGEPMLWHKPETSGASLTLRLDLDRPVSAKKLTITLNAHPLQAMPADAEPNTLLCQVLPQHVRLGENVLTLTLANDNETCRWLDMRLDVNYSGARYDACGNVV